MATKTPAKKTPAKAPTKALEPSKPDQTYAMPKEVAEWIEHANSRVAYLTSENTRLKDELAKSKVAQRAMEHRIMGTSQE